MKQKQDLNFFALSKDSIKENTFTGIANIMGKMDSYKSVIYPGAFSKEMLENFVKDGFISLNHNTAFNDTVATISRAWVEGNQLLVEAEFHSTATANKAKSICLERLEKGKSVGLSIGGRGMEFLFSDGEELIKDMESRNIDMSLVDVDSITKHKSYVWGIPSVSSLVETALTFTPANIGSEVLQLREKMVDEKIEQIALNEKCRELSLKTLLGRHNNLVRD